ncbi:MAG: hypothetical protein WBP54_01650 [Pelodictyon phaeoclathratiforme]
MHLATLYLHIITVMLFGDDEAIGKRFSARHKIALLYSAFYGFIMQSVWVTLA